MNHVAFKLLLGAAVLLIGCNDSNAPEVVTTETAPPSSPLRLLVVEDPELAQAIVRVWSSRSTVPLKLIESAEHDFVTELESTDLQINADAIIYPTRLLGSLAESDLIAPMPARIQGNEQLAMDDMFPLIRSRELRWGATLYAVPFGSPHLSFVYRSDVFEQLDLRPPTTWQELADLSRQLSTPEVRSSLRGLVEETTAVLTQPLAAGSAGATFLARAAPLVVHPGRYSAIFDFRTMQPLIGQPPFVQALEAMVADHQHGSQADLTMTPALAASAVAAGRSIMAIGWVVAALDGDTSDDDEKFHRVSFAEMPGSTMVYSPSTQAWEPRDRESMFRVPLLGTSGRVGSVLRRSRRERDAWNLLVLLSGAEWGLEISPSSRHTSIARPTQATSVGKWLDGRLGPEAIESYSRVVTASQSRRASLFVPRLPGHDRYMQALDTAVRTTLAGDVTAESALQTASLRWNEITDEMGRDRQARAYQRSLGLVP